MILTFFGDWKGILMGCYFQKHLMKKKQKKMKFFSYILLIFFSFILISKSATPFFPSSYSASITEITSGGSANGFIFYDCDNLRSRFDQNQSIFTISYIFDFKYGMKHQLSFYNGIYW